jgi:small GTP-binding protein
MFFTTGYVPTFGINFSTKTINENNKDFKINIWDAAGQKIYRSMLPTYCHSACILLFTVDLSKNGAITETMEIFNSLIDSLGSSIIVIVGTKSDLECKVTDENINVFATEISESLNGKPILYIETSAKTGEGITRPGFGHAYTF